jgi:cytochrome c-type biogenesis protein CcsB
MKYLSKLFLNIVSEKAALIYLLIFATAIAVATFIENDFGTDAAQKWIYKATWFTVLLVLFGASIASMAWRYQLWQRKRYAVLLFHISILIILVGALVTRLFGFEGVVAIREGQAAQQYLTSETYLDLKIYGQNQEEYAHQLPVLFSSLGSNHFSHEYTINTKQFNLELLEFIPNAKQAFVTNAKGKKTIKIVFPSNNGRQEVFLSEGERKTFFGMPFNFTNHKLPDHINILPQKDSLLLQVAAPYTWMEMASQNQNEVNTPDSIAPLHLKSLYTVGKAQFVFAQIVTGKNIGYRSTGIKISENSQNALKLRLSSGALKHDFYVVGNKGQLGQRQEINLGNYRFEIAYGSVLKDLPFSLYLRNFDLKRYPGTTSPASFSSYITLIDNSQKRALPYHIYMNHVLDHRGYRFFQSSYDPDEKGTYLSMNHDYWGSLISYIGYILLTIGLIWTLLSKNTRFSVLRKALGLVVLCTISVNGFSQTLLQAKRVLVSEVHADLFSQILVQDFNGRFKPMHTLNREIMRKVYGNEVFESATADQVVLSIFCDKESWFHVPVIKIGAQQALRNILHVNGEQTHMAYQDFFDANGAYKLQNAVNQSAAKTDKDKSTFDKELLKLDERVSILNMIMSGTIFKIIPLPNDPNHTWVSQHAHEVDGHVAAQEWFNLYLQALHHGMHHQDYSEANQLLAELDAHQRESTLELLPSQAQRNWEIRLNNSHIFEHLTYVYLFLGLAYLTLLIWGLLTTHFFQKKMFKFLLWFSIAAFVLHSSGLLLRWYISERAPWSNGYESMIYIAWAIILAAMIFARKSTGALSAGFTLSAIMLVVAQMSYFNPEITPLEPVLNSYWLTIHVSMEAGSYGFLLLGGMIGLINLVLISLSSSKRILVLHDNVKELTILSEMTITGGLVMLSIGTYLGGVWANESWGRYWGWDAKETWALVSILVYALILHLRFLPKLNNFLVFNIASIFGFASILMTYFGVNYYLSGLHSYAAGDPIPVPNWIYVAVALITMLSIWATIQFKRHWTKHRGLKI